MRCVRGKRLKAWVRPLKQGCFLPEGRAVVKPVVTCVAVWIRVATCRVLKDGEGGGRRVSWLVSNMNSIGLSESIVVF